MRIAAHLVLIFAGWAILDGAVAGVARSNLETSCKIHKRSPPHYALLTLRHQAVASHSRPAERLANIVPPPRPSESSSPTAAESQNSGRQGKTSCTDAMDKLRSVEPIAYWLSLPQSPHSQLGYLYTADDFGNTGDSNGFQELDQKNADDKAIDDAVRACRSAAEQGDALAQFSVGVMYASGRGLPRDYAEAAKWWRKTADQGLAVAQSNLGVLYNVGKGVPQNKAEAAKWTRLAADQGLAAAQYDLGRMYTEALGVPYDLIQAHMWLNLAGAQGYGDAIKQRDIVAVWIGSTVKIDEAERLAATWSPTGARLAGEFQPRQ
jgi:hypothetical protein